MLLLSFINWTLFSCVLMSFIEHQVHARVMHKRLFLSKQIKVFDKVFRHHAILHHGTYTFAFSDEPLPRGEDKGIRLNLQEGIIESLFFAVPLSFISDLGAFSFVAVVALHHMLWNSIHLEMHKPEQRFFSRWPVYKFLARHHMLHHKYPTKNLNVVFPLADYILGTAVRPKYADIADFYRAKLLPRQTQNARNSIDVIFSEDVQH